jgi:hypothetical protein
VDKHSANLFLHREDITVRQHRTAWQEEAEVTTGMCSQAQPALVCIALVYGDLIKTTLLFPTGRLGREVRVGMNVAQATSDIEHPILLHFI